VGELPSMDAILSEARKRERKSDLVLGTIVLAGGLVVLVAAYATFGTQMRGLYVFPAAAVSFGVSRLARALR